MFKANTRSKYRENVSHSVEEMISKLEHHQTLVRDLEQQLSSARVAVKDLEDNLTSYLKVSLIGIGRLPAELLLDIFKLYLEIAGHQRIWDLLLVCHSWHRLIVNTQSLWTSIHVRPAYPSAQNPTPYSRLQLYVKACLKRSGTQPLDIRVDYDLIIRSADELTSLRIHTLVKPLVDQEHLETSDWFRRIKDQNISASSAVKDEYRHLHDVFDVLIGPDGCHRRRWKTLKVFLCGWHQARLVLEDMLSGPCPSLVLLDTDTPIRQLGVTPNLKTLRLRKLNEHVRESVKYFDKSKVERFVVGRLNLEELKSLTEWRSLRELRYTHSCSGKCHNSRAIIYLPTLRKLILHNYTHECCVTFDLPSLEQLTLKRSQVVPNISAPSICLDLSNRNATQYELYSLLLGLNGVQRLVVFGCERRTLEKKLEGIRQLNELTPTLQKVEWAKHKGDALTHIRFIRCSANDYRRRERPLQAPCYNYSVVSDDSFSSDDDDFDIWLTPIDAEDDTSML
ncbi:hypothetical protein FRC17_010258 [Serendipita sp. 399]|nr:hypothetical protein FRC17_010258 [Serendipita sp. 399]